MKVVLLKNFIVMFDKVAFNDLIIIYKTLLFMTFKEIIAKIVF